MKGLDLAREYYRAYGADMIKTGFPELENRIAVGLCGSGSECFGYDDELSQDHDFGPGFCMFVGDDLDSRTLFALERAYARLPKEFMGFRRPALDPAGGNRRGVLLTSEFFTRFVGRADGELSLAEWLTIPESYLFEATDGEIFRDDLGEFSAIRKKLSVMPEDVRLKKLAGNLMAMSQAGQYNYMRLVERGEVYAAQLAAINFANAAGNCIFLLNKAYSPYYKWRFRRMKELPVLGEAADDLGQIISTPNDNAQQKYGMMEEISSSVAAYLMADELSEATCGDLSKHAVSVNDRVSDPALRNADILIAV